MEIMTQTKLFGGGTCFLEDQKKSNELIIDMVKFFENSDKKIIEQVKPRNVEFIIAIDRLNHHTATIYIDAEMPDESRLSFKAVGHIHEIESVFSMVLSNTKEALYLYASNKLKNLIENTNKDAIFDEKKDIDLEE